MYSILLVDDEKSVLDVLCTSVGWQELGVDKLLTASDGYAALEQFEQHTIDLLIADIRMPRMDGMELIRKVREISPDTHCILLTAYSEFEYAREAIRLGVDNYLLKPIAKEEIEQTVHSALDNIYQNRHSSNKLLEENTLRRWATGMIGVEELSDRATALSINLYQAAYCVVCIARKGKNSIATFRADCIKRLSQQYEVNRFWDEKGYYILILGGKTIDYGFLEQEISLAAKENNAENLAAVSFGPQVAEAEELQLSYRAAVDAVELADLQNSQVILSADIPDRTGRTDLLTEEIRVLFYERQEESRRNGYRHLALKLCKNAWTAEDGTRLSRACIQVLVQEFPTGHSLQEQVYHNAAPDHWPEDGQSAQQAVMLFLGRAREIFENCLLQYSPVVQRTIYYVREGVLAGQGVSLKEFCARTGMNPAYLGHIFKTETGAFFNDYLTRCRVERSIILLRNPNRKIKDIAEEVGFAYASYYVKCFRGYKGVSPTEYRQKLLGQEEKRL